MINGADLLASLGSAGWRIAPHPTAAQDGAPPHSFENLLSKAKAGDVRTDRPVVAAPGAPVDETALSRARDLVDLAESRGVARAAVLHRGHLMRLDVADRRITPLDAADRIVTNIDGLVVLDDPEQPGQEPLRGTES